MEFLRPVHLPEFQTTADIHLKIKTTAPELVEAASKCIGLLNVCMCTCASISHQPILDGSTEVAGWTSSF